AERVTEVSASVLNLGHSLREFRTDGRAARENEVGDPHVSAQLSEAIRFAALVHELERRQRQRELRRRRYVARHRPPRGNDDEKSQEDDPEEWAAHERRETLLKRGPVARGSLRVRRCTHLGWT